MVLFVLFALGSAALESERLVSGRLRMNMVPAVPSPSVTTLADIREIAKRAALRHRVDPFLIQSMISVESSFQPLALSPKGAMGVMQLMPVTADEMGVADPFDVRENIDGGVRYIKKLLRRYRGNLRLALAAYNAGPTKIRRYRGIPPYRETRQYVRKVISRYRKLKERQI